MRQYVFTDLELRRSDEQPSGDLPSGAGPRNPTSRWPSRLEGPRNDGRRNVVVEESLLRESRQFQVRFT